MPRYTLSALSKATLIALGLLSLSACSSSPSTSTQTTASVPVTGSFSNTVPVEAAAQTVTTNNSTTSVIDSDVMAIAKQYLPNCSDNFKRSQKTFIAMYGEATALPHYATDTGQVTDFINSSVANESATCEMDVLNYAALISGKKLEQAEYQSAPLQHINKMELDLFEINIRQGLLTEGASALVYGRNANLLWSKWAIVPVDLSNEENAYSTMLSNETMQRALVRLSSYLKTHQALLAQNPTKRAVIIDQALIYTSQLNQRYVDTQYQISDHAQSSVWIDQMVASNLPQAEAVQGDEINTTLANLLTKIEQQKGQNLIQFFELTRMRYVDFDNDQMLESAKAFLLQDAEYLPLSQLLVAMDYAKLGDRASSERWLDKVADNSVLMSELCAALPMDNNYFAINPAFFNSAEGQWFKEALSARCS